MGVRHTKGDGAMSDEITKKIVEFVEAKIDETRPDPKLERLKSWGAIVASIATLTASIFAFVASLNALSIKSELDHRQILLDENLRISSIYYKKDTQESCGGIALDETSIWQEYRECMLGKEHRYNEDLSFKEVTDIEKRLVCLKKPKVAQCT